MRVVIHTFGSWGDLFPFIPIGRSLVERGHDVVFAVPEGFRDVVICEGFEVRVVGRRLTVADHIHDARRYDVRPRNPLALRRLWQTFVVAELPDVVRRLTAACSRADVLVAHPGSQAAPIVVERTGIRWVTASPVLGMHPSRHSVPQGTLPRPFGGAFGRTVNHAVWLGGRVSLAMLLDGPVNRARRRAGARSIRGSMFRALSPHLCLELASPLYEARPPDWPPHVKLTGFSYFDSPAAWKTDPRLGAFLERRDPLVVFTLGFSAGMNAGEFFNTARSGLSRLGTRGLFLGGWPSNVTDGDEEVFTTTFAPLSVVLPHAAAVVHAGGYGSTAQALRSGVPQVVVPWGFDQLFHARTVTSLGLGRRLSRSRLTAERLLRAVATVRSDDALRSRTERFAGELAREPEAGEQAADEIAGRLLAD